MSEKYIFNKYPNRIESEEPTPLSEYGIQCDKGWIPIVNTIADNLHAIDPEERIKFVQVKEKFGGLRFYITISDYDRDVDKDFWYKTHEIIHQGENVASRTCEVCGKEGSTRRDIGWLLTLCEDHYQEAKERNKMYDEASQEITDANS